MGGFGGFLIGAVIAAVGVFTGFTPLITMGVTMMVSGVVGKLLAPDVPNNANPELNTSSNIQIAPATDNKIPVVYGSNYVGGTIIDLSITSDNQNLYYVLAICEVTNYGADTITFGDIYYEGKKCIISGTSVTGLQDVSTGAIDTRCNGYINIYLYNNGSLSPVNTSLTAIQVMQSSGLTYTWDNNKLMTNCAFAIIQLTYNSNANVTSLGQTQFQVTNSRNYAGDCIYDYLSNTIYGAGVPTSQIDTTSLTALNTYSNQIITFNDYLGNPQTQPRFQFNGTIDTSQTVLSNLQDISNCADTIIKYNEIYGLWGVIVQTPTYTVAMDINDSNMVSNISTNIMDISNTYNIAECQYPDVVTRGSFNTTTLDLHQLNPSLLYPNEPINKQTIKLPLVNNNVQAQLLATRNLKSARLDLQIQCTINFIGLELEAGDIVTVTNANYGWVAKLFRIMRVDQTFNPSGEISVSLVLQNYDPSVFNDVSITQYAPPPKTGLPAPNNFGTITAPTIISANTYSAIPTIIIGATTSSTGITEYIEIWYSSASTPTSNQYIFAGTSAIQPNGNPYGNNVSVPNITLSNIPAGNWYFFSRMVNAVATSNYSSASALVQWRPATYQFSQRYLSVAYADNITGTGFSFSPSGKTYYGLSNQSSTSVDPIASDYTWYLAPTAFGTTNYLLFNNYGNKLIGFSVGLANVSSGGGAFVPSDTTIYDPSIWLALPIGTNIIDLNYRTGQVIQTGTTSVGTGELAITNNADGLLQASLATLLTFPGGATTYTSSVASLTIDRFGRVIGLIPPDTFYYTMTAHIATSGQTVFSITRGSEYLSGNSLVFQNGCYLNSSQWTDGSSQITLAIGANLNDVVTIISMASVAVATSTSYNSFTINSATLSSQANYTASGWLVSGNELIFLNGTVVNAQDYNIVGQVISFNTAVSGDMQVIQWANNNQSQPNGHPQNFNTYTVIGQTIYPFTYDPNAFNLYNNGVLLLETVDFTVTTGSFTLSQTPTSTLNILVEQTFNRTGAV